MHDALLAMSPPRSQPQPASSDAGVLGGRQAPSARAGSLTLAQLAAAAGYVAFFAFTGVPDPFSFGAWAFMLLPPAAFAFLFVTGLFGVSTDLPVWQRVLSGVGSLVCACALAVGLVLLPLNLFGSLMDYAIG